MVSVVCTILLKVNRYIGAMQKSEETYADRKLFS